MKKLNLLKKLAKGTAAGGITGYSASFASSTPTEEDKNSRARQPQTGDYPDEL
jgi:hypothetical protein